MNRGGGEEDCFMLSYFVIVFFLSLFNAGQLISHQVQVSELIFCNVYGDGDGDGKNNDSND